MYRPVSISRAFVLLLFVADIATGNFTSCEISPKELDASEDESVIDVYWKQESCQAFNVSCFRIDSPPCAQFIIKSTKIVSITTDKSVQSIIYNFSSDSPVCFRGNYLGVTDLAVHFTANDCQTVNAPEEPDAVLVLRVTNEERLLYRIFIIGTIILVLLISFGFGCQISLHTLWNNIRKPGALAVGLVCQLVLMPLLSVLIATIFQMSPLLGFGLLVTGCAPSGGSSNVWTLLMDGDLELSLSMTFISKTCALGTMIFWLFVLGPIFTKTVSLQIPYVNILSGLAGIAAPCLAGVALKKVKPKAADMVCKMLKVSSAVFLLWVFIMGSITNFYVYQIMRDVWYIVPAGLTLPLSGMILGFTVAKVFKRTAAQTVAISIETGVQDTGLAIVLLLASFPKPEGSIAATLPVTAAIFTAFPLIVAFTVHNALLKCKGRDSKDSHAEDGFNDKEMDRQGHESGHQPEHLSSPCDATVKNSTSLTEESIPPSRTVNGDEDKSLLNASAL